MSVYKQPNYLNRLFIPFESISISWIFNYLFDRRCLQNVKSVYLFTFCQKVVLSV